VFIIFSCFHSLQIENGSPEIGDRNSDCNDTDGTNDNKSTIAEEDAEKIQPKVKAATVKEKKVKKSTTATVSPKGKQSPKSKKEAKAEEVEEEEKEKEVETGNKEKEKLQNKKQESELRNDEPAVIPNFYPNVKIIRVNTPHTQASEVNDSVVEVPHQDPNKSHESAPSTSSEESSSKLPDIHSVKDSPRRSTRLATHLSSPKQKSPDKPDSSSIIVLDSDDSISVMEVSQKSRDKSFAQSLRSLSGRPSLRPLPAYRSFNRPSTIGSASVRSNLSSRSGTTTGNDSESDSQESKILRRRSGLWGLFRTSSQNALSQDYATDNESTNRSLGDDSGNDSEATTDPPEAPSNLIFGKRKSRDAGLIDEAEQEKKRIRGERGQKNNANTSGLLSIMSSPMNLFASKIRGEKGKSSTPVHVLKASIMDEETKDDLSVHQDVSEIQYEEENPKNLCEKGSLGGLSSKMDEQEVAPRRWCSIM